MTLLYAGESGEAEAWTDALRRIDPDLPLRFWPDWGDPAAVEFVIVAGGAPGDLSIFPHLKAVQSTWAGVNRLLQDRHIPPDVPIARMIDPGLTIGMSEYVAFHALDSLRGGPALRRAQEERRWISVPQRRPEDFRIGLFGLGELGQAAASALRRLAFRVSGWSREAKSVAQIATFAGRAALPEFLRDLDMLVVLLPLTPATTGILNADLFALMKPGAILLNAARGAHLNEADLLAALESGRIGRAILDVFAAEPLPPDHPFWSHPKIFVSPHNAAITRPGMGAATIVANYRRALASEALENAVDRRRGY